MELKFTIETVFKVKDDDFKDFVIQRLGLKCKLADNLILSQLDQFDVSDNLSWYDSYDEKIWDQFKLTGNDPYFHVSVLLNGLVADGHIQPGIYRFEL